MITASPTAAPVTPKLSVLHAFAGRLKLDGRSVRADQVGDPDGVVGHLAPVTLFEPSSELPIAPSTISVPVSE